MAHFEDQGQVTEQAADPAKVADVVRVLVKGRGELNQDPIQLTASRKGFKGRLKSLATQFEESFFNPFMGSMGERLVQLGDEVKVWLFTHVLGPLRDDFGARLGVEGRVHLDPIEAACQGL
jgi:hypothetical protein